MWTLVRRTVVVVAVAGLGLWLLSSFAWMLAVPIFDGCEVARSAPQVSPDGRLKAEVVKRDCGATTAVSGSVLVTSVRSEFDDRRDEAALFKSGAPRVEWSGRGLRIFKGQLEPLKAPDKFGETQISYWNAE